MSAIQKAKTVFLTAVFAFFLTAVFAEEKRFNIPIDNALSYGSKDAPITVIEFIDYQ